MNAGTNLICVDDDAVCLEKLRHELDQVQGIRRTRYYQSAQEALAAHEAEPADVVISDLRMGAWNGIDLISKMRETHPDALYMLLSGDADLQSALTALNEIHVFRYLLKPAKKAALQLAIDAAITELNLCNLRRISIVSHAAVQKMRAGIAYLDTKFRVIFSNAAADDLMRKGGGFDLDRNGALCSARHAETLEFHELLRQLQGRADANDEPSLFRFAARAGAQPVIASIVYHLAADITPAYYSVVFCDPSTARTTPGSVSAALNILPSEAKIVHALAEGLSVEEAAQQAQVSVYTARTYLRNVYEKTGVSRQAELIRLVMLTAA